MAMRAPLLFVSALLLGQGFACSSSPGPPGRDAGSGGGSGGTTPDAGSGSGGSDAPSGADRGTGGAVDSGSGGMDTPGAVDVPAQTMNDGSGSETPGAMLPPGVPAGYKLLLDESFASAGSVTAILAGNPADWTHSDQEGGFLQYGGVGYAPPNPPVPDDFTSFALLRAMKFGSFVLEVEFMQTSRLTGVPVDMSIVFGIKSETELYFAHIAQGHTERFHNIVIINKAPRRSITKTDNGGVRWGINQWHKVRLVRDVATGDIAVYMDGALTTPILTATDTTFSDGYIGFGTHEDSGRIRNLKVWGASATAEPAPATFFR
ncbi:MAG TPA: hypothetical protein VFH73_24380 [Polyangia bacterium]|jgi:hypothetical protein|nr:hypothetical protein [Polyangia bacterium]